MVILTRVTRVAAVAVRPAEMVCVVKGSCTAVKVGWSVYLKPQRIERFVITKTMIATASSMMCPAQVHPVAPVLVCAFEAV
jgi:hypothetical protein